MTLSALRDDALTTADDGFALRLGLPWIRSLPLASLLEPEVTVDGSTRRADSRSGSAIATSTRPP